MRTLFVSLFYLVPIISFSQNFKISEPNVDVLKTEIKKTNHSFGVSYLFLIQNYDSISKKENVVYYDYPDYSICSFSQDFENGITYSMEQCREAGGMSVSIVLPKTEKESLVNWIEGIFQSEPVDNKHSWNSDKTKFGPTDETVGCYFEIQETETNTIVENYCGC